MSKKKHRLKPISFYGNKPEDVIRAICRVDKKKIGKKLEFGKRQKDKKISV